MKITKQSIINFIKALTWHIYAGFPKSSQAEINRRFAICNSCELFDKKNSQCLECGCNINNKKMFLNKLAWADQKCPMDKW